MIPPDALVGPCNIECRQRCEVPAGAVLVPVPRPRHAWGDVLVCPHEGCDKAFWIWPEPNKEQGVCG